MESLSINGWHGYSRVVVIESSRRLLMRAVNKNKNDRSVARVGGEKNLYLGIE